MNLFYFITLYLWDYIFSIIDKNEIKILRIICKDFRNISINYWFQNIPNEEVNNYFINNQKLNFNIRFIILQHQQQFDFKNLNDNILLFISCIHGYLEIVKLLIKINININQKNKYEVTSLIKASNNGNLEIVKLLLENEANINEKDSYGWSPLIYASFNGYLEIVKLLIKNGVNINEKNNIGNTALYFASKYGYLKIVKLLVKNGANINQKDNN